jgi:hypothetical protein
MKSSLKPFLFICFSLLLNSSFSQKDKEKILANFDYVDYYPDSTIRSAHKFTGVSLERFTVEFDKTGKPVSMGKYKKGAKIGSWTYSNGSFDIYDDKFSTFYTPFKPDDYPIKSSGTFYPGCGTGVSQAIKLFNQQYDNLISYKDYIDY